jgi:hypothetical protein
MLSKDIANIVSKKSAPWMWQVLCDNIGSSTPTPRCVEVCKFIAECVIWEAFQQLALATVFQHPSLDHPDYCSERFELDSTFELLIEPPANGEPTKSK